MSVGLQRAADAPQGFVRPGFERVREAFAANLAEGLDVGAAFAVRRGGETLVDLWGGYADAARALPLRRDALFNLWSATKGLAAACIALLVDQGRLSYSERVAAYWPEFAKAGKDAVTVGQLMSHQAGLCGPAEPTTLEDYYWHARLAARLAAQAPFFQPGSWGYHALTAGVLADELVRRVDGRPIGRFFAEAIARPMQLDAFMGLPAEEDHRQVETLPPAGQQLRSLAPPNPAACAAAVQNPPLDPAWANQRAWRAAGLAAGGGSANARSLSAFYDALLTGTLPDGRRLLSRAVLAEASSPLVTGVCQVTGSPGAYGAGYRINTDGKMGPNPRAFGHAGWGGSVGFADPDRGLGVAFVANQMRITPPDEVDPRLSRLLRALYAALDD